MKRVDQKLIRNSGFTLIELLIVVVILGLLASIVVPQLAGATDGAKEASLQASLIRIRSAIDMYYQEHGIYPGTMTAAGATCPNTGAAGSGPTESGQAFSEQLTMYTNRSGQTCTTTDEIYKYGPYLKTSNWGGEVFPENPITNVRGIWLVSDGSLTLTSTSSSGGGWKYDNVVGKIIAHHQDYDHF